MFIFPQFINNRDVIPPSSFPNEFQTTQHGLHDWCVMYYNVVIVCRLTSPVGPGPYCWLSKLMSPVHMASVRSLPGSAWNKGSCSDVLFTPDCFLTQLLLLIVCMFVGSKTHFLFIIMKYKVVQNTQPIGSSRLQRQTGKVCMLVHANLQNHQSSCLATVVNRGKQLPIQLANTSEILIQKTHANGKKRVPIKWMLTLATTLDVTLNQELPFAERTRAVCPRGPPAVQTCVRHSTLLSCASGSV